MQISFQDEKKEWAERDGIKSVDKAVALIAQQTAIAISLYCRSPYISDYNNDGEDFRMVDVETKEDAEGNTCYMNGQRIEDEDGERLYPNGKPFTNYNGDDVDDQGKLIPNPFGNDDMLKASLAEISEFATKHGIPFHADFQFAMGKLISDKNDDFWQNSSIGC